MTGMAIPWDRLTTAINARLPLWARYEGYGTKALGAYVYVAISAVVATLALISGMQNLAIGFVVFGVLALLLGNYWRGAAKLRVRCSSCERPARGKNICPHCGEQTYLRRGGETA